MFGSELQRARVCKTLLSRLLGHRGLWTDEGPTEKAVGLIDANGGPLSSGERVLLLAAAEVWGASTPLEFGDIFRLDNERLHLLGSLLVAMGAHAVEEWLTDHGEGALGE